MVDTIDMIEPALTHEIARLSAKRDGAAQKARGQPAPDRRPRSLWGWR
jgi:hypothetical protein